jgi:hypothetical protein
MVTIDKNWVSDDRFKLICDELEVAFKPSITFTVELGGYVAKEDLGSK